MAGIYLHIPFCKQACTYCNFHFSTTLRGKDELLQALLKEITLQKDYLQGETIETIYFGGGTPSLLSADELKRVLDTLHETFPVAAKEVTLEANPDDLSPAYLKSLNTTTINRLSIGIQSFREADLKYMNRAHTAQQSDYAIKAAQDAGFTNLSIDLIYGTPGLTDADWKHNLQQVQELSIPHFSSYALTVEEGTALHHAILKKKSAPVDNDQAAAQFEMLMDIAPTMGYEQYEISNLAIPGMYALHNTNYWRGIPYLGIGPSAHSFNAQSRRWNVANNALYTQNLLREGKLLFEEETLTGEQRLNEYIMTSLRTMWGCDLSKIETEYGTEAATQIKQQAQQWIEGSKLTLQSNALLLTKAGKLLADGIAADLFL